MARRSDDYIIRLSANNADLKAKLADSRRRLRGYKGSVSSLGAGISKSMTAIFAVGGVLHFSNSIIGLIKELDNLNRSLKAVTDSEKEYDDAQKFLSKSSDAYGVSLNTLTGNYVKFLTAVKDTKIEGREGEEVFRKITKAGAVLSLSNEQLAGTFKALEQMLSKGSIQSEELRGQLAERLPGAYKIMAKSMGITTMELGKQLKAGNVMAEDVLPKFADQLLVTYGADKVARIDSVTAASNRTKNAWVELVASFDTGDGIISNSFKAIHTEIQEFLKGIQRLASGQSKEFEDAFNYYSRINEVNDPKDLDRVLKKLDHFNNEIKNRREQLNEVIKNPRSRKPGDQTYNDLEQRINFLRGAIEATKNSIDSYNNGLENNRKKAKLSAIENANLTEQIKKASNAFDELNKSKFSIEHGLEDVSGESLVTAYHERAAKIIASGRRLNEQMTAQSKERGEIAMMELDSLNNMLNSQVADAIGSFAEELTFSGIDNAFEAMLNSVSNGLSQFGSLLIAQGFAISAFNKSLLSLQPGVAIAAGIALKLAAGAVRGHAAGMSSGGGSSSGGGFAQGNNFTPLKGQSQRVDVYVEGVMRGKDVVFVYDSTKNTMSRTNG